MVEPAEARGTDVHAGALPDGFQAFEHGDVAGIVMGLVVVRGRLDVDGNHSGGILHDRTIGVARVFRIVLSHRRVRPL
jgi:hypothetical protein